MTWRGFITWHITGPDGKALCGLSIPPKARTGSPGTRQCRACLAKQQPTPQPTPEPIPTPAPTPTPPSPAPAPAPTGSLFGDLTKLPRSGTAWMNLKAAADAAPMTVTLTNQDSTAASQALAMAFVYRATGDATYRAKANAQLDRLVQVVANPSGYDSLALFRQGTPWFITAHLLERTDLRQFALDYRHKKGDHSRWTTVSMADVDAATNQNAWALATTAAVAVFTGNEALGQRARDLYVAWGIYGKHPFRISSGYDQRWTCLPPPVNNVQPIGINPRSCGEQLVGSGAPIADAGRGTWPSPSLNYPRETLGALTLTAMLLQAQGVPSFGLADSMLRRLADWCAKYLSGGILGGSASLWLPHALNHHLGTNYPVPPKVPGGRNFIGTDWLYGR